MSNQRINDMGAGMTDERAKQFNDDLFRNTVNLTVAYAELLTGQHIPGRIDRKKVESKTIHEEASE